METTKKKTRRVRSPKYPNIDLEKAIDLTRKLYEADGLHEIPSDVAAVDMGYSAKGSVGIRAISALLQYDLANAKGSGKNRVLWLSELSKDILLDKRDVSKDRDEAIRSAALRPSIYMHLFEKYGGNLPSDNVIETYLLREQKFNPKVTRSFIIGLRTTFEFAGIGQEPSAAEVIEEADNGILEEDESSNTSGLTPQVPLAETDVQIQKLTIPLIGGGMAILSVPVPLSKQNFDHLVSMINAMGVALVAQDEFD